MPALMLVLAVVLTSPFGGATAAATDITDGLTIDVVVEVDGTFEAVLFRPFSTFEELAPTALRPLAGNQWGGAVTLPTAEDWLVVFDAIEPDGNAIRSDTTTLSAMGVDPVVISGEPEAPVERSIDSSTWWLVAGAVLAFAALAALAWWTFSDDSDSAEATSSENPDEVP
ncbi:MAG: hypothetical protein ACR2N9_02125 [Acidimicrobiia bacterium]